MPLLPPLAKKHFVPSNTNSRVGPFYVHMVGHNCMPIDSRLAKALNLKLETVEKLAAMSHQERMKATTAKK